MGEHFGPDTTTQMPAISRYTGHRLRGSKLTPVEVG